MWYQFCKQVAMWDSRLANGSQVDVRLEAGSLEPERSPEPASYMHAWECLDSVTNFGLMVAPL